MPGSNQFFDEHSHEDGLFFNRWLTFQLSQYEKIIHKRLQKGRIPLNRFQKFARMFGIMGCAVEEGLGITSDRSQGRFELMRNVRDEILPHCFRAADLCLICLLYTSDA